MDEASLNFIGPDAHSKPLPTAALDIVFVHGLGGDAIKTWSATGDPEGFWPRWLAQDVAGVNVWSAGYSSSFAANFLTGPGMTLISRASSLLDLTLSHGLGTRPIIFITHSLGGLLVKQLLRTCGDSIEPKRKALLKNTKAVIFCATPHQGAKLATALDAIFSSLTSAHVKQMKEQCEPLANLHTWFVNWATSNGISVKAYYETKKTSGIMIVSDVTANPNLAGCEPIAVDGDHKTICKPLTHESAVYVSVTALISEIAALFAPAQGIAQAENALAGVSKSEASEGTHSTQLPEILTDYEMFTTIAPDDRRSLSEKLIAGNRAIEIADAERKKERFAKTLRRNAAQASSVTRYTRIMAEVESRFKRHVRPLIVQNKSEGEVNAAVQTQVINPIFESQAKETDDVTTAVIDCALYYLTGNCHVRWDHHKD